MINPFTVVNELGEIGATALAEVMSVSPIPWLKLNLNGIIFSSPSLIENHIGDSGFNALMDVIEKREASLNELSLSRIPFHHSTHY